MKRTDEEIKKCRDESIKRLQAQREREAMYLDEVFATMKLTVERYIRLPFLDAAITGICSRFGEEPVLAYDVDRICHLLTVMQPGRIPGQHMSDEEAMGFFENHILSVYRGPGNPVFIYNTRREFEARPEC